VGAGCREGEKDESLDTKQVPGLLVHAARVTGFVNIAAVGPMQVEKVFAAVNKKGVVIKEGPAVAAVQMGCNLLPVMALVVETSKQLQTGNYRQEPLIPSLKTQMGEQGKELYHQPIWQLLHGVSLPNNA
jgi:hypothetical protein